MKHDKAYYIQQGALKFIGGKHIACYGKSKVWQHKALNAGDMAYRLFIFGSISPGYDAIKKYHNEVAFHCFYDKDKVKSLEYLNKFIASDIYKSLVNGSV